MIYEFAESSLGLLRNQWSELADAFRQLADSRPADDPDAAANAGVWRAVCEGEVNYLEMFQIPRQLPANALGLAERVLGIFRVSEGKRARQVLERAPGDPTPGFWDFYGPEPGIDEEIDITVCRHRVDRLRTFIASQLQSLQEITSNAGQRMITSGIKGSIDDISSYPILTSSAGAMGPAARSATVTAGEASLQRMAETTLRRVLGRTPRLHDPRAFVAALSQSFQIHEVEGQTKITWLQRRYVGQTELGGGVSGAQASLYARAKTTLDSTLPLLDGLYPLLPDPDEELVSAARAIARAQLIELVNELGVEGGPRIARVDRLFNALLEEQIRDERGEDWGRGYLEYLQRVFGLFTEQINTLEEEVMVTNFTILQDYVTSLRTSWVRFRQEWEGRDLGTRLVLLERALAVVAETVEEVYAAMDSVFVGEAERQVASFRDGQNRELLVSEFLSWVTTFATEEAPLLIDEGGRRGVGAIIPTSNELGNLVSLLIRAIPYGENIPDGLRHPRVVRPLQELEGYLRQVLTLSQGVWRP